MLFCICQHGQAGGFEAFLFLKTNYQYQKSRFQISASQPTRLFSVHFWPVFQR